jgi:hypothetical protein
VNVQRAKKLGAAAFACGKPPVPGFDESLGGKPVAEETRAWLQGWCEARQAYEVHCMDEVFEPGAWALCGLAVRSGRTVLNPEKFNESPLDQRCELCAIYRARLEK